MYPKDSIKSIVDASNIVHRQTMYLAGLEQIYFDHLSQCGCDYGYFTCQTHRKLFEQWAGRKL